MEPRNADLERIILESPDDEAAFRVYGDWLAAQDHPRGELVALCRTNDQVAPHLIDAFVAAHPELWAELRPHGQVVQHARWRLGFIDSVTISDHRSRMTNGGHPVEVLGKLLDGPGRFVRSLTLELALHGADVVLAALAARGIPTLRSLAVHDTGHKPVVGVERLLAALPRLERLHICGNMINTRVFEARRLRELLLTSGLNRRTARAIAAARLPDLESLRIAAHAGWRADAAIGDALAPLLAGDRVPGLRHLALTHLLDRDGVVHDLLTSPLVHRLESLDLSNGRLHAVDCERIRSVHARVVLTGNPGAG